MPTFAYRALTDDGEAVQGEVEAADAPTAIRRIQDNGLIPIEAAPVRERASRLLPRAAGGRAGKQVTQLTRELATLTRAGQTLEGALALVREELADKKLAAAVERILERVRGGMALSDSLGEEPAHFPGIYKSMVRAGEAAGRIEATLEELAQLRERTEELQSKLTSALIYPAILVLTAAGAVTVLMTMVVPQLEPMFAQAGSSLPGSTAVVLGISQFLRANGTTLLVVLLLAILLGAQLLRRPAVRVAVDGAMLRAPLFGPLARERVTAQFCRGLSTLLAGGLDLPQALEVGRGMLSNAAAQSRLDNVISAVRNGRSLADALGEAAILTPTAAKMLRVGEESGALQSVSFHLANSFEDKVNLRLQRLVAIVEPTMVIGLGLLVGGIVTSILTAVISVNELAF